MSVFKLFDFHFDYNLGILKFLLNFSKIFSYIFKNKRMNKRWLYFFVLVELFWLFLKIVLYSFSSNDLIFKSQIRAIPLLGGF